MPQGDEKYWTIHGRKYDLTSFIDRHPGGRFMILLGKGRDCTELFESVHALSSTPTAILAKYEVKGFPDYKPKEDIFSWETDGFYDTVRSRVRKHFENKSYKATWHLVVKLILITLLYCFSWWKVIATGWWPWAVGSGIGSVLLLFNLLHDASHGALSKNPAINMIGIMYNSVLFWNPWLWMQHHVFSHHSYTGIMRLDPDIVNSKTLIRKHGETPHWFVIRWQHWYWWFFLLLVPNQHVGQILLYTFGYNWTRMFNRTSTKGVADVVYIYSPIIMAISFYVHVLLPLNYYSVKHTLLLLFIHYTVSGMSYSLAVAPNHDQQEVVANVTNNTSVRGKPKLKIDWGEQQVRASGNHSTTSFFWSRFWNFFLGGLHYQIEHHLFPTISHVHFPDIAPIVRQACEEFNLPYHSNSSFSGSIVSFTMHLKDLAVPPLR